MCCRATPPPVSQCDVALVLAAELRGRALALTFGGTIKTIVWHHTCGARPEATRPIVDALARAGIGALPIAQREAAGAGIVFFEAMSEGRHACARDRDRW
jgi:hypothetical protein